MSPQRSIVVESRRKSLATIQKAWPTATIVDVTSKGEEPWVRFSPFWPHGNIPVPGMPGATSESVEGLWQTLKVFEKQGIDVDKLQITNMKGIKRSVRTLGSVRGHSFAVEGDKLLNYLDARRKIYLPAYHWVLEHKLQAELAQLREIPGDLVLLDYETNSDIEDLSKPLSHASLIKRYLEGTWPNDGLTIPTAPNCVTMFVATIGCSFVHVAGAWETTGLKEKSRCIVDSNYYAKIEFTEPQFKVDTSDCTVWSVRHLDENWPDKWTQSELERLLEQSIHAVSELVRWQKGNELQPSIAPQLRGFGRLDVKTAVVTDGKAIYATWISPRFRPPQPSEAAFGHWIPICENGLMRPNPFIDPYGPYAQRLLASFDLFNMGFYTEAVLTAYALVDDLVQQVVQGGMAKKITVEKDCEALMRAISSERLKQYTGTLMELCGWNRLQSVDKQLYSDLVGAPNTSVNKIRNEIMHGSRRLQREESRWCLQTLIRTLQWLRENPFGFTIGALPAFHDAHVEFTIHR